MATEKPPSNPYESLEPRAFWRPSVADRSPFDIGGLWRPRHRLQPAEAVVTFGSCFAQHIGRALRERGFNWLDAEPAPPDCPSALAARFGYGVFSARTGNIYTATALRQWVDWASDPSALPDDAWEEGGRWFDPFRPSIEPDGFASREELLASRAEAARAFGAAVRGSALFVFTLGLTESWVDAVSGREYAMCPGTGAGRFDPSRHVFRNAGFAEVRTELLTALRAMRRMNPAIRVLLTVSPVPLTATASGEHVLVATTLSKSVLRAVAGSFGPMPWIDYFPSYEIICSAPFGGMFYEPNKRNVNPRGVAFVMDSFFEALGHGPAADKPRARVRGKAGGGTPAAARQADEQCDEALLEAFGPRA